MEHLVTHLCLFFFADQINADNRPPLPENHSWQTATSSAPARHPGTLSTKRLGSVNLY